MNLKHNNEIFLRPMKSCNNTHYCAAHLHKLTCYPALTLKHAEWYRASHTDQMAEWYRAVVGNLFRTADRFETELFLRTGF